jgi:tape measure domain-containing protein
MSRTVDERVLSMQFDNRQFESNVRTSMSTLEKLKQSLKLTEASKGLEGISTAAKRVDMSPMANGIETVRMKFSALEVMAVTALANITNSAVNAGKRMISAITVQPIKDGFAEYETQMNAVQTILANTQKEGTNVKTVNAALDELNHYADKTIYNFTEMTRNIGTFTAAGVKLDTSVSAIKGIANLAAVSGSSSQQASTAMYQLSQALASGTVKLQDWNSVVNAGMGGQVFQDALIRTSEHLQTGAKAAIDAKGSFRESLQTGWLTTEVLTQTLDMFATAADTQEEYEAAVQKFVSQGYTQEEAKQMADMAKTAGEAATKVKTFSQLIDTLKEALGSGWTETWRTVIGDFEEARELWTNVSDVLSDYINKTSDARNAMVKQWADLGGRTAMIDSFKNAFKGLVSIIAPIKEAFREIFPPMTAQQLFKITEGVRDLTAKFILSDSAAAKVKNTFKGVFSVIDIGVTFIKDLAGGIIKVVGSLLGFSGGILDITSALGDWVSKLRDSIKESDAFGKAIDKISGFIVKCIDKLKDFGSALKEGIGNLVDGFKGPNINGFVGFLKTIAGLATKIGSGLVDALKSIMSSITDALGGGNFLDTLNNGIFTGILLYIGKFFKNLSGVIGEAPSFLENVKGVLDDVRSSLEAYQNNLKAETLKKIAVAIGILAAAIFVLSTINAEDMSRSLTAITVLFGELLGSLFIFNKMDIKLKGVTKAISAMIGMSVAVLILAGALKKLSSLSWNELAKGLVGVAGLVGILIAAAKLMDGESKTITKFAGQMIIMTVAVGILSRVAKSLSSMSWEELGKAGAGVLGLVGILVGAAKIMDSENAAITKFGGQMIMISVAVGVLGIVAKSLSSMSWEELSKAGAGILGLVAMLVTSAKIMDTEDKALTKFSGQMLIMSVSIGLLALVGKKISSMSWGELGKAGTGLLSLVVMLVAAAKIMDSDSASITKFSGQMLLMSASLAILAPVLKSLGSMSWEGIAKGLIAIGVALAELATGLYFMTGTLGGSAALIVASVSLMVLVSVLAKLGSMSVGSIVKSLVTLGGAIAIIGAGAALLTPVIPALLGLSAAFALLGLAMVGIGAGLTLIGIGLTSIAAAGTAAATSLVASLTIIVSGILELIPTIMGGLGEAIVSFCQLIGETAPQIAEAILKLLSSVLESLTQYAPQIIDSLVTLIIELLDGLAARAPEFLDSLTNFLVSLINGLSSNIGSLIESVVGLVSSIIQGVADALSPIVESVLAPILEGLKNIIVGVFTAIGPYIPSICDAFTQMTQIICDAIVQITAILAPFIPNIQMIAQYVMMSIQAVCNAFVAVVGQISPIIQSITGLVQQLGNSITQILYGIRDVIAQVGASISQILVSLGMSFQMLGSAIRTALDGVADVVVSVGEAIKMALDGVANIISSVGDSIKSVFEGIGDVITSVGESIKSVLDGLANVFESIGQAALDAGTGFDKLANGVVKITNTKLSDMAASLTAVATGLGDIAANSDGLAVAGTGMQQIANGINMSSTVFGVMAMGVQRVVMALQSIGPVASASMSTLVTSVLSSANCFTMLSTTAVTAISMMMSTMALTVTSGSFLIITAFNTMMNSVVMAISGKAVIFMSAGLAMMSGLSAGIMMGSTSVTVAVMTALSNVVSIVTSRQGIFISAGIALMSGLGSGIMAGSSVVVSAVMSALSRATAIIISQRGLFTTAGVALMSGLCAGMLSASGTVAAAVMSTMSSAVAIVMSQRGLFTAAGMQLMVGLRTGIMSGASGMMSAVTMVITRSYTMVLSRRGQFTAAGRQLIVGLASGLRSGASAVTGAISSAMSSCSAAIRMHWGSFYFAGIYLGQGLTQGIASQETAAYNAGYRLGQKAVQGEKDGQKSASPSKLTKQAGRWLGEGLVIGMDQMGKSVYKSGKSMGENAVDSITGALTSINDVSAASASLTPTIRPVVDMDELQNGSSTLRIGADLSASLLSKPVNTLQEIVSSAQDSINASNNEVIKAINELRADLNAFYSGDDTELALYMDSKKVASTLAKPMNRQLLTLQKRGSY